ncbi:SIMPL domain-containing protein [Rummeliibacillus stabekisii]|uniref:SIMPL domain-containing protein n=1 Tax=Rummeliibacillus stabekisii TaxID=241244 RepID=A0A143HGU7_9BACL|nr:SIMPL domain-containing protein [Rummeliibacillus stabekisii]AMX00707.1 hypothetical protein ATY39_15655 [Rummeliibacillus stabekisii]
MYYQNMYHMPTSPRLITVTGFGEVAAAPNYVKLQVEVITKAQEARKAQKENAVLMNQVIQSLLSLGIQQEDMQTASYRISPNYDFIDGNQLFRGFEVSNALAVNVREMEKVALVIDTAVKNGANSVSGIVFKLDDAEKYNHQALQLALLNARRKAKAIAATMNVHISSEPIEIEEIQAFEQPLYSRATLANETNTPIEAGLISVSAALKVTFHY